MTQNYNVLLVARNESVESFEGLNHLYTPGNCLYQIDAYMIFTMGEQPLGPIAEKLWHGNVFSLEFLSAGSCDSKKFTKLVDPRLCLLSKNNFLHRKLHITLKLKSEKETENVNHYVPIGQHLIEKGWFIKPAGTSNLNCNEVSTRGLPKRLKNFAHKRQVEDTSTAMDPSVPFHTLVTLVDAEVFTIGKTRTLG